MKPTPTPDELTRRHTAFENFAALLDARGGYRPSMNTARPQVKDLADAYDHAQAARGDPRRAFRWTGR